MADLTCGDNGSNGQAVITRINENTHNIDSVEADVALIDNRVAKLEIIVDYYTNTVKDLLDVSDTYTEGAKITATLSPGKYTFTGSHVFNFNSTNKSAYIRTTINGSSATNVKESKDTTDVIPLSYTFPFDWTGGSWSGVVEFKKEDSAGTLNVLYSNMIIEKKAEL